MWKRLAKIKTFFKVANLVLIFLIPLMRFGLSMIEMVVTPIGLVLPT